MAHTVSSDATAEEYKEYLDEEAVVLHKVEQLANMIREHRGRVMFCTGAGISTGAGVAAPSLQLYTHHLGCVGA